LAMPFQGCFEDIIDSGGGIILAHMRFIKKLVDLKTKVL